MADVTWRYLHSGRVLHAVRPNGGRGLLALCGVGWWCPIDAWSAPVVSDQAREGVPLRGCRRCRNVLDAGNQNQTAERYGS